MNVNVYSDKKRDLYDEKTQNFYICRRCGTQVACQDYLVKDSKRGPFRGLHFEKCINYASRTPDTATEIGEHISTVSHRCNECFAELGTKILRIERKANLPPSIKRGIILIDKDAVLLWTATEQRLMTTTGKYMDTLRQAPSDILRRELHYSPDASGI